VTPRKAHRILLVAAFTALAPLASALPLPDSPAAFADRLEAVWRARDVEGYLALWAAGDPATREQERDFAHLLLAAEESQLVVQRPGSWPAGVGQIRFTVQFFTVTEPRGRFEESILTIAKGPAGWALLAREPAGEVDGLLHLSFDPAGFRADGLILRLPDFELHMTRGTLFTAPASLGPTLLLFVGEGRVQFRPQPATEQEQLRQFCGAPELVEKVRAAFIRIHPASLRRVLNPARFDPDASASTRLPAARAFYREHSSRAFVLDAALPRSPWWLLPGLGDAYVTFETARRGTLTLTVSANEPEQVSLFDRDRRRQICLYPIEGGSSDYDEDAGRAVDVQHHVLQVRFDAERGRLAGEDTIRVRTLVPSSTLKLRLNEGLRVESITSKESGNHLFFRVRHQDSLMVSLGVLSGTLGEITLHVRYSGRIEPTAIESEVLQAVPRQQPSDLPDELEVMIEDAQVFTTPTAWYPQGNADDHATADMRFDVARGSTAVAGGERTFARVEGERTVVHYRQDQPGRYIAVAVGRLADVGSRQESTVALQGFAVGRLRGEATAMLDLTAAILRFFTEEFGPPPYTSLNLVAIEGRAPGGHSPPGMVIIARRPLLLRGQLQDDPGNFSDVPGFFLAHELAHQWWGHGVAGKNYHERWLSEAIAQYAAALWVQRSLGDEEFRDVLRRMARWAFSSHSAGPINLGYRLGHIKGNPKIFRAIVYDKGAYVLHMLRAIVGDEAFRNGMRAFQSEHRFRKAGTHDLRLALETASGQNLSAYFGEWVFGTAPITLNVSHRSHPAAAGYETSVQIRATGLPGPAPVQVAVVHERGREIRRVLLSPEGGTWVVPTASRPGRVEVNGDGGLLAKVEKR